MTILLLKKESTIINSSSKKIFLLKIPSQIDRSKKMKKNQIIQISYFLKIKVKFPLLGKQNLMSLTKILMIMIKILIQITETLEEAEVLKKNKLRKQLDIILILMSKIKMIFKLILKMLKKDFPLILNQKILKMKTHLLMPKA